MSMRLTWMRVLSFFHVYGNYSEIATVTGWNMMSSRNEECKSGSLADDLTDIYCELKSGLLSLEENLKNQDQAIDDWRCGYKVHWGKHLVDAEKHFTIYRLKTRYKSEL